VAEQELAHRLQVLIASDEPERLGRLEAVVEGLGHDVIGREGDPAQVARLTRELRPDLALVGLGESDEHALNLIGTIVQAATCPVIAVLNAPDPAFVAEAARRGIFAYVSHETLAELQSAIALSLQRFASLRGLETAFVRRAVIERAKGILMERHRIGERDAFELLRVQSQHSGRKLADVAAAVVDSHLLLPATPAAAVDEPPPP
jgi:response regulator NasT